MSYHSKVPKIPMSYFENTMATLRHFYRSGGGKAQNGSLNQLDSSTASEQSNLGYKFSGPSKGFG